MKVRWPQLALTGVIVMLMVSSLMALNIRDNFIATLGLLGLATTAWCVIVLAKSLMSDDKQGE